MVSGADATEKNQIVLTLVEGEAAALHVASAEVWVNSLHVLLSPDAPKAVESVLHVEVARAIREICAPVCISTDVVSAPEFRMRSRGVSIEGYRIAVEKDSEGARRLILRLVCAGGSGLALLRLHEGDGKGLSALGSDLLRGIDERLSPDQLFDEMLSHLYLPLVNLNSYLRNVLDGQRDGRAQTFAGSVVQLKTKAEMLQFAFDRLISEMMLDRATSGPRTETHARPVCESRNA